ncbi:hypothetical protein M2H05_10815 [Vibrio vulnificus]|nr:hypothetical protein [Vibrio sp. A1-1]MCU8218961.1 hypothetical protein [Vibrio vulnificus]
MAFSLCVDSSD